MVGPQQAVLGHFAFCAQVALHLAEQDQGPLSTMGRHLFLLRWLVTAQKQKRFPKTVAADLALLIARGRKLGVKANLASHLETLYRLCHDPVYTQSDLFRLTGVIEALKGVGWHNYVLSDDEWGETDSGYTSVSPALWVAKARLHSSFDDSGAQTIPLELHVVGALSVVTHLLSEQGYHCYQDKAHDPQVYQRLFISATPLVGEVAFSEV